MYLNIEKELNKEQLKAVTTIDGPILILAGAGSGKTKTITYRMYYMIEVMKINPENILAVSFTNKAALEMEHRLRKLIGGSKADKTQLSTFHSLGVKILKQEIEKLGYQKNFDIFDTSDQLSVVREALYHLKAEKNFDRKVILQKIGLLKNMGISEEDFKESNQYDAADPYDEACEHVYHYYQEKLKFYNAIDFDDILFLTIKLFRNFPDVKNRYSAKFKYIMVDEYQDTNDLQFELIRHLTATHNNICVVGDDDQSIYAFRGANVTNILNFPDYFKPCTIIKLEQNYRSHQSILHLANNVIKNNVKRSDKKLWTDLPEGEKPMLWSCLDPDHEVSLIVEEIQKMQKNGVVLSDVAILFRSNSQMQIVEDQLRLNNIPHYIVGGQKFYDKKEIKDIISYLSLIQNFNNDIALRRVINTPHRGIGKTTLEKYIEFGKSHKCSILNAMIKNPNLDPHKSDKIAQFTGLIFRYKSIFNTTPLPDSIKSLLDEVNYDEFIEKSYELNSQILKRKKDVSSFIESSIRFEKYQIARGQKGGLKNFLEKLLLVENSTQDENNLTPEEEMGLFTLHSSKGLEFKYVFLIGVEEDLLPHKRTIAGDEDISEERRLFYVGITRAREKLIMSFCQKRELYGKEAPRFKSRFLSDDVAPFYQEIDRTKFNHLSAVEVKELKKNFFSSLMDKLD